jgi:hypothetical protein
LQQLGTLGRPSGHSQSGANWRVKRQLARSGIAIELEIGTELLGVGLQDPQAQPPLPVSNLLETGLLRRWWGKQGTGRKYQCQQTKQYAVP